MGVPPVPEFWPWLLIFLYPLHLLLMSTVLRVIGVPKEEVAKWALKHADRQRLTDLIKAARNHLPPAAIDPPDEPP
jgi:hypothetical protein